MNYRVSADPPLKLWDISLNFRELHVIRSWLTLPTTVVLWRSASRDWQRITKTLRLPTLFILITNLLRTFLYIHVKLTHSTSKLSIHAEPGPVLPWGNSPTLGSMLVGFRKCVCLDFQCFGNWIVMRPEKSTQPLPHNWLLLNYWDQQWRCQKQSSFFDVSSSAIIKNYMLLWAWFGRTAGNVASR